MKRLKTIQGFSMIETLIALGVLCIAGAASMTLLKNFKKGTVKVESVGKLEDIRGFLRNKIDCSNTFDAIDLSRCDGVSPLVVKSLDGVLIQAGPKYSEMDFMKLRSHCRIDPNNALLISVDYQSVLKKDSAWTRLLEVPFACPDPRNVDKCDENNPLGLITFETLPDGSVPRDNLFIQDQYRASHGVSFCLLNEITGLCVAPVRILATDTDASKPASRILCDPTTNPSSPNTNRCGDQEKPGQPREIHRSYLGNRMLFDNDPASRAPALPIAITYTTPVAKASGVLGDVDGGNGYGDAESVTLQAFDSNKNKILEKIIRSGDPGTGNGLGTYWEMDTGGAATISQIRLVPKGVGIVLDRFSASEKCEVTSPPPGNDACDPKAINGLIDFEVTGSLKVPVPPIVPTPYLQLRDQFWDSHGVRFCNDIDANNQCNTGSTADSVALGRVGGDREGWLCNDCKPQNPDLLLSSADKKSIGQWFLTYNDVQTQDAPVIIEYKTPVAEASGLMIDIDGDNNDYSLQETFRFEARDANRNVVASMEKTAGDAGTGDAKKTFWSLKSAAADIHSIKIWLVMQGKNFNTMRGFAFDNFSPTKICPE